MPCLTAWPRALLLAHAKPPRAANQKIAAFHCVRPLNLRGLRGACPPPYPRAPPGAGAGPRLSGQPRLRAGAAPPGPAAPDPVSRARSRPQIAPRRGRCRRMAADARSPPAEPSPRCCRRAARPEREGGASASGKRPRGSRESSRGERAPAAPPGGRRPAVEALREGAWPGGKGRGQAGGPPPPLPGPLRTPLRRRGPAPAPLRGTLIFYPPPQLHFLGNYSQLLHSGRNEASPLRAGELISKRGAQGGPVPQAGGAGQERGRSSPPIKNN